MPHTISSENVFVARQPVFRPDESVWGYELLFRAGEDNVAIIDDESQATSSVIADGFSLAMEGMNDDVRILINFPEQLLLDDVGFALSKDLCVVEILENVRPTKAALDAARRLKKAGYTIAVDDYFGQSGLKPFLELADIVKVDVLEFGSQVEAIEKIVRSLPRSITLLAEKVENRETFTALSGMGFSLFQGFFFSKPEILPGRKLSTNEMTKLQLLKELADPNLEPGHLATILQSDPSLAYRLFRYVNSAGMGLRHKVESIKRALDMMGMVQAKQWLRSVIIADMNPTPRTHEMAYLAVHRAKFLESICTASNTKVCIPDALFMTGLFSLLDAMLGMEMPSILKFLPLDEPVAEALQGRGDLAHLLRLAISYERGNWSETARLLKRLEIETLEAELMYVRARSWTQKVMGLAKSVSS